MIEEDPRNLRSPGSEVGRALEAQAEVNAVGFLRRLARAVAALVARRAREATPGE